MKHKVIGELKSGEAIYVDGEDNIAIEKDHSRLVEPTPAEWREANRIYQKNNAEAPLPNGDYSKALSRSIRPESEKPTCESQVRDVAGSVAPVTCRHRP